MPEQTTSASIIRTLVRNNPDVTIEQARLVLSIHGMELDTETLESLLGIEKKILPVAKPSKTPPKTTPKKPAKKDHIMIQLRHFAYPRMEPVNLEKRYSNLTMEELEQEIKETARQEPDAKYYGVRFSVSDKEKLNRQVKMFSKMEDYAGSIIIPLSDRRKILETLHFIGESTGGEIKPFMEELTNLAVIEEKPDKNLIKLIERLID